MNPDDLEKLVTRRIPFGKYEGRLIADLPGPYLNWFAREGFPRGEIGQLLHLMREIDHNGLSPLLDPPRQKQPEWHSREPCTHADSANYHAATAQGHRRPLLFFP